MVTCNTSTRRRLNYVLLVRLELMFVVLDKYESNTYVPSFLTLVLMLQVEYF